MARRLRRRRRQRTKASTSVNIAILQEERKFLVEAIENVTDSRTHISSIGGEYRGEVPTVHRSMLSASQALLEALRELKLAERDVSDAIRRLSML